MWRSLKNEKLNIYALQPNCVVTLCYVCNNQCTFNISETEETLGGAVTLPTERVVGGEIVGLVERYATGLATY